jgi:trans-2,3-dihydro-3-hydroxyanthranilate isomerase
MRYQFHTLDVFTERAFGGNPLAVFPDAADVPVTSMPLIARELNLSETVFVLPPLAGGASRLRIFTPGRELPFAGHPTIGTADLLAELGRLPGDDSVSILEEGVGPVPVRVRRGHAQLTAARRPEVGPPPPPRDVLARLLGLAPRDIVDADVAPAVVSCGVPFLLVPLVDRAAVGRARLDPALARTSLGDTREVFIYARDAELPGSDLRARMFAPELGIFEDPATGAAATTLAGYLALRRPEPDGQFRWTIEQGFEMGRPSLLYTEADKRGGQVTATRVAGNAVRMSEGHFDL